MRCGSERARAGILVFYHSVLIMSYQNYESRPYSSLSGHLAMQMRPVASTQPSMQPSIYFVKLSQPHCRIYSSLPIKSLRIFPLTTPPTPKAGTILPIRAIALTPQSLVTLANRSPNPSRPCRLNRSSPSRWTGVLNSCIAAGARN
jgi:hypothetical protein